MAIYNVNGDAVEINAKHNGFQDIITYSYQRDDETGIFYTTVLIPQQTPDGNKQYPFVYYPNYPNSAAESALELSRRKKFLVVIGGGRMNSNSKPYGTVIQNSINRTVLQNDRVWDRVLTIDNTGTLGYAEQDTPATTLISNGIVSAVMGFIPLITDFKDVETVDSTIEVLSDHAEIAQRIAICQYDNGDYAIISAEARGFRSATGNTQETLSFKEMQQLCKKHGVKFAFALDGGGSASIILGEQHLLPLYDAPNGRKLATFIVFNGSTSFADIV